MHPIHCAEVGGVFDDAGFGEERDGRRCQCHHNHIQLHRKGVRGEWEWEWEWREWAVELAGELAESPRVD